MGKSAKGSRKGKKAWRANISTADIDDYFEKTTKDALAGAAALPSVPSDSLFYVDKSTEVPIKRKIEKHREKVLHYESILQKNSYVQPVPSSTLKKLKRKKKKDIGTTKVETQNASQVEETTSSLNDLWEKEGEEDTKKSKKKFLQSIIPAVEVEPAGCSYNPPSEAHKESLAQAVAAEMQKIYEKELGPQPVPLTVLGEAIAEDDRYFLDADDGNESEIQDDVDEVGSELPARQQKTKRITRVELNKRARRKEQLRAETEARKVEHLAKEIDSLPDIMKEIAKEDGEKQRRRMRRVVAKQERLKSAPPRLGKHKFEPAPLQVLLTEEISGSLRKLKGCATLTRDRFKSLEKRGLIAPNAKKSRRN